MVSQVSSHVAASDDLDTVMWISIIYLWHVYLLLATFDTALLNNCDGTGCPQLTGQILLLVVVSVVVSFQFFTPKHIPHLLGPWMLDWIVVLEILCVDVRIG